MAGEDDLDRQTVDRHRGCIEYVKARRFQGSSHENRTAVQEAGEVIVPPLVESPHPVRFVPLGEGHNTDASPSGAQNPATLSQYLWDNRRVKEFNRNIPRGLKGEFLVTRDTLLRAKMSRKVAEALTVDGVTYSKKTRGPLAKEFEFY